jgi:transposase
MDVGERNGRVIWQKLRASGYQGVASHLRPDLALLRQFPELAKGRRSSRQRTRTKGQEGSIRRLVVAVFARPKQRTAVQTQMLTHASQAHPDLAEALLLAQRFIEVFRERQTDALLLWLEQAKESSVAELQQFAQGIERDQMAVEAALTRSESQGQVAGQINKLKFIKRSMFGRAGFDLLRSRVLKAA